MNRHLALLCLPALLQGQATPHAMVDLATSLTAARPGATGEVRGKVLAAGGLRLELGEGRAGVLAAGGRPRGLFFEGRARLQVTCSDPAAFAALATNLRRFPGLSAQGSGQVRSLDLVLEALQVHTAGLDLPALAEPARPEMAARHTDFQRTFSYPEHPHAAQAVALAEANAPGSPLLILEGQCGVHRLRFTHDAATGTETLEALLPGPSGQPEGTRPVRLFQQRLGGPSLQAPLPGAFLREVDIALRAEGSRADITSTLTFQVSRPTRLLRTRLLSWVEGPQNEGLPSRFPHQVLSVRDGAGRDLPFHHQGHQLLVELPATLAPDTSLTLSVHTRGEILQKWHRGSWWSFGDTPWFPMAPEGNLFTGRIRMDVPASDVPLAPGVQVRRETREGRTQLETRLETAAGSLPLAGGAYTLTEHQAGGVTLRLAGQRGRSAQAQDLLKLYGAMVVFCQRTYGAWPFREVMLVEGPPVQPIPGWVFSMPEGLAALRGGTLLEGFTPVDMGRELLDRFDPSPAGEGTALEGPGWIWLPLGMDLNPTCSGTTLLSQRVHDSTRRPERRQAHPTWANHARALQITRQIFGQALRPLAREDDWLFHGFAAQAALKLLQAAPEGDRSARLILDTWKRDADAVQALAAPATAPWLAALPGADLDMARAACFSQGARFVQQWAESAGEPAFLKAQRLLLTHAGGRFLLSQADVLDLLRKVTGKDQEPFYTRHALRTASAPK